MHEKIKLALLENGILIFNNMILRSDANQSGNLPNISELVIVEQEQQPRFVRWRLRVTLNNFENVDNIDNIFNNNKKIVEEKMYALLKKSLSVVQGVSTSLHSKGQGILFIDLKLHFDFENIFDINFMQAVAKKLLTE